MRVLRERDGHRIAGLVEYAKVAAADGAASTLDLSFIEPGLQVAIGDAILRRAIGVPVERIVAAALQTAGDAGVPATPSDRSEERRVGKEGVRTRRSRWSPYHTRTQVNKCIRTQTPTYTTERLHDARLPQ